jgi:hypothetical protein
MHLLLFVVVATAASTVGAVDWDMPPLQPVTFSPVLQHLLDAVRLSAATQSVATDSTTDATTTSAGINAVTYTDVAYTDAPSIPSSTSSTTRKSLMANRYLLDFLGDIATSSTTLPTTASAHFVPAVLADETVLGDSSMSCYYQVLQDPPAIVLLLFLIAGLP